MVLLEVGDNLNPIPLSQQGSRQLGLARVYCAIVVTFLPCLGCFDQGDRPELGEVTGVVTLDGEPLANASIAFTQKGFRPSVGHTDSEGRYELVYIRDIKGVAVGTHLVRIRQFGKPGRVPARYDTQSELTREVQAGENIINFELMSEP